MTIFLMILSVIFFVLAASADLLAIYEAACEAKSERIRRTIKVFQPPAHTIAIETASPCGVERGKLKRIRGGVEGRMTQNVLPCGDHVIELA